jgi:DNA-binding NarL/FixJ family response regulator
MASLNDGLGKAARSDRRSAAAARAESDSEDAGGLFAHQARRAFVLLQAAIGEAAEAAERQNVKLADELRDLQLRALRSMQDSALAAIELFEALGAARTPGELASRQIELARRQRQTARQRLEEFLLSARRMAAVMADPLQARPSVPPGERAPANGERLDGEDSLSARLESLTARQKGVLALLAEGLPNKMIAFRLGISETTVKAHVGVILRKLGVYNRARAIVMLTQFDFQGESVGAENAD